jgi:hypothetical protein
MPGSDMLPARNKFARRFPKISGKNMACERAFRHPESVVMNMGAAWQRNALLPSRSWALERFFSACLRCSNSGFPRSRGNFRFNIGQNTSPARHIRSIDLIVMDDVSILIRRGADRTSRTLRSISDHREALFGGKKIFCGSSTAIASSCPGIIGPRPSSAHSFTPILAFH